MDTKSELIPHLFRTEFSKITSVLCKLFGFEHIEIAEDIASDTFLLAAETWKTKGIPDNPVAWLYAVAKNRAKDYLKRNAIFSEKVKAEMQTTNTELYEIEIDLSNKNISDSLLQMMFAICNPSISTEAQIGLSLRILCGFGIEEIADAFLSNKETINKRLFRAKEKLRQEKVKIEFPSTSDIDKRLETVLTTIYLLFNEGYYSLSQNTTLRKDLCLEAMRLNYLLIENEGTNKPAVNALLSLMCFHASRFEARINPKGELILYEEQDTTLWNKELILQGEFFLNKAAKGNEISKYHLEAAIAYWHTNKQDTQEKWENILQFYNKLLLIEYSPIAALNRTYALAKATSKTEAIIEAEKLKLTANHLYYSLLGYLYTDIDNEIAIEHLKNALKLAKSVTDKATITKSINKMKRR
ncbi:MAG: polymerase subunit sigma [Mucilaginibacter sp.]|nr:polymerase subunit sigma [Mucilaginibacter sp.]